MCVRAASRWRPPLCMAALLLPLRGASAVYVLLNAGSPCVALCKSAQLNICCGGSVVSLRVLCGAERCCRCPQERVQKFIGGLHYKKWTLFYRYQQQFGNRYDEGVCLRACAAPWRRRVAP